MNKYLYIIISVIIGLFVGISTSTYLFVGSYLALIPWAVAGILIGFSIKDKSSSIVNGVIYGVVLTNAFLISDDKNFNFGRMFILLVICTLLGIICGAACGYIGNYLRKFIWKANI